MNILCRLGFHKFPVIKEWDWVVCERRCLTEKQQSTGIIKSVKP